MINPDSLVQIVGPGNVSQESDVLEAYSRDMSFVNPLKPRYVAKPQNKKAIQALVRLANETQTPLVPVSSGAASFPGRYCSRSWGLHYRRFKRI